MLRCEELSPEAARSANRPTTTALRQGHKARDLARLLRKLPYNVRTRARA